MVSKQWCAMVMVALVWGLCGCEAHIKTTNGPIDGQIQGLRGEVLVVENAAGQQVEVAPETLIDIDHPGNGAAVVGGLVGVPVSGFMVVAGALGGSEALIGVAFAGLGASIVAVGWGTTAWALSKYRAGSQLEAPAAALGVDDFGHDKTQQWDDGVRWRVVVPVWSASF